MRVPMTYQQSKKKGNSHSSSFHEKRFRQPALYRTDAKWPLDGGAYPVRNLQTIGLQFRRCGMLMGPISETFRDQ